jgi:hypothetical protein
MYSRVLYDTVTCMLWAIWHVLTTVAMATDKQATMEATSVFFVVCPKATMGSRVLFAVCFVEVFSLWSVHGLYNKGPQPTVINIWGLETKTH